MDDRTRAVHGSPEAAAAFAVFVLGWLEEFAPLVEALYILRGRGTDSWTYAALMSIPEVRSFRDSWEVWDLWTGQAASEGDRRLEPHLGPDRVEAIRFALWGDTTSRPETR